MTILLPITYIRIITVLLLVYNIIIVLLTFPYAKLLDVSQLHYINCITPHYIKLIKRFRFEIDTYIVDERYEILPPFLYISRFTAIHVD